MKLVRYSLAALGVIFLAVLVLPATPWPWRWAGAFAEPGRPAAGAPDVIVLMGGGGIPSRSGLMRAWKTAEAARVFPEARVIVAMPFDDGETWPGAMEHELAMRGVEQDRLSREPLGRNTREQAVETFRMVAPPDGSSPQPNIALVTCPDHMRRTWRAFEHAGFTNLIAYPAWAAPVRADLSYDEAELGAKRSLGGAIGGNDMIKYRYWDNLELLVKLARESVALVYYRAMGWVAAF